MQRLFGWVTGIGLLAALVWVLLGPSRRGAEDSAKPETGEVSESERDSSALVSAAELEVPSGEDVGLEREEVVSELEPAEPPAGEDALVPTIRGRFVLPDGSPGGGVHLKIHGAGANQERTLKFGKPEGWVDPEGSSEADGTFELFFDPPRAYQFILRATVEGYAETSWRWGEILPGKTIDVGEVVLLRGGAIEGRIVDRDGESIAGKGWSISASSRTERSSGRNPTRGRASADAEGRFRIEGMPPGLVDLSARHDLANRMKGVAVTVVGGETVEVDIVYDGPLFENRITVTTFSRPFYVMNDPEPSSIKLYGGGPEARVAEKIEGSSQSYSFDELEPGAYTIEVDDPRYLPWRQDGVRTGTEVNAHLKGSASFYMDVRDADSGKAIELYSLRVRFRNVNFSPNEFEVHDGKSPVEGGLFEGMFPGDYTVTARAEDGRVAAVEVDELLPGEARKVTILVGRPTIVTGRVTSGGRPVAGIDVLLLRPAEVDDSPASPILNRHSSSSNESKYRKELDAATTDAGGRFELQLAAAGTFALFADQGGGIKVATETFTVAQGETKSVNLALPGSGRLVGRILASTGELPKGLRVWVLSADPDRAGTLPSRNLPTVKPDGSFDSGLLKAGDVTVYLFPPANVQRGFSSSGGRPLGAAELGTVSIPDGEVVERDFTLAAELPGTLRVTVRNHGQPLQSANLTLVAEDGGRLIAVTDAEGRTGPIPAFPGTWTVHVTDPGGAWTHEHPTPVGLPPGAERLVDIDVQATEASLTFMDIGTDEPLAHRKIAFAKFDPDRPELPIWGNPSTTDGEGRFTVTLPPGEYRFVLDPVSPFERIQQGEEAPESREARVFWSVQGPDPERVQL